MIKNILITGGGGFIGFHLAKSLVLDGCKITILENFSRGRRDEEFNSLINLENVNLIEGDITNSEIFNIINQKFDSIFHFAAINGTENFYNIPDKVLKVGVIGTINILDWFIKEKMGKLIFASSSEVYAGTLDIMRENFPIPTPENIPLSINDPTNPRWSYGGSKILGELAFHAYEKAHRMNNWTIVRFHNIYGPRMGYEHVIPQIIGRIKEGEDPFTIYDADSTRSFCYIDDAVDALKLVMESKVTNKDTINIGRSDGELTILELVKKIFTVSKASPELIYKKGQEGSVKRRCPDIKKLESLGFKPSIDINEGIENTYNWYMKEKNK